MKFKFILLFALATTFITACTSNEDPEENSVKSIIGTWNVTAQTLEATSKVTTQGITFTSETTSYAKDIAMTYTFSENPNVLKLEGTYTNVITTTLPGQDDLVEEFPLDTNDLPINSTWSLDEDILTIIEENNTSNPAEIIELTDTKLVLKTTIKESFDQDDITISTEGEMLLTLEK